MFWIFIIILMIFFQSSFIFLLKFIGFILISLMFMNWNRSFFFQFHKFRSNEDFQDFWRQQQSGQGPQGEHNYQKSASRSGTMSRQNALHILGLPSNATVDQIKKRHRELMLKHHPDRGGDPKKAALINQAKDVLLKS